MSRERGVMLLRLPDNLRRYDLFCALGMAHDGKAYIISTEGVGWEIEQGGLQFDGSHETLGTPDILKRIYDDPAIRSEDRAVDLADWVRTFGARLEGNFYLWYETLRQK